MSTLMLRCGCSFSFSMFGDRRMMGFNLCLLHVSHPKVQDTCVKDLLPVIKQLLEDEPPEVIDAGTSQMGGGTWSIPSDEKEGAGCLL